MQRFNRHDWVWLKEGWASHLLTPLTPPERFALDRWLEAGRPLVVCRHLPGDAQDSLRLGLAQPNRGRLALHLSAKAVAHAAASPSPCQVMPSAPDAWRPVLAWLEQLNLSLGLGIGVYGSLAWQHQADDQTPFLSPTSDLDLLFHPRRWAVVERLLYELREQDRQESIPKLDGEIILPDGGGVSWRELAQYPDKVLVKRMDKVELLPVRQIAGLFQEAAA